MMIYDSLYICNVTDNRECTIAKVVMYGKNLILQHSEKS